ncbi:hypothetical protein [Lacticaseibacillus paracasei]|uniref:hypothetical protein n=1 Tax=Lacticaseibacillus paracasei TaxID=1597 RepID=UPI0021CE9119|nr:hypothetical protein [Lacticaseibacillus paracasei]MCU6430817.1 hypothetical protein [Lacticaseibacillus paracasei]
MLRLIAAQIRVVFFQQSVVSAFIFIIFMSLQVLLVGFGKNDGLVLKPYNADQQLITWTMSHLPWLLSYLLPSIWLFPTIERLRNFITVQVEMRLSGRLHYTLASYATILFTSTVSTLSFSFSPILLFHQPLTSWELIVWIFSITTASTIFFCFAMVINETFALIFYLSGLILTASMHQPYLVITSLHQPTLFTLTNLVSNLVYFIGLFFVLLLIFKRRRCNLGLA